MSLKVLVSGGGTGGSVSPVLAVVEELKKLRPKVEILFVGTNKGPERVMVHEQGLRFVGIPAAKFRRYFSIQNVLDVFVFVFGFIHAFLVVRKFKPDVVFSVGSFVSVPVCWAGKIMGAKIVVHQQDARVGLANKLVAPIANSITTAFEFTSKSFYSGSGLLTRKWKAPAQWVGNPVRQAIFEKNENLDFFRLEANIPVLLILGGATGSTQINRIIIESLPKLLKSYQVVHVTGKSKSKDNFTHPNYHPFEFIKFKQYAAILKKADLVVTRAGLSTITELSALGKVAIVVPMPDTHQEDNAMILKFTSSAIVLNKHNFNSEVFPKLINDLTFDPEKQKILSANISKLIPVDAGEKLAKIIIKISESK
ncbi:MAG: UDP-N-acetylglucosamine--N-acetylmuramyl-(pentapeptide) pyrophosphoryl-undecaprenol N-acetylglucosamine transferase [bacterium]|nr:UDP-N-acetylglucosamine--N-acetylmuramyl-(pentapeptide) pyrophosphoryl-undecaprenol N-acetylglucosamine transferase [bacterium]